MFVRVNSLLKFLGCCGDHLFGCVAHVFGGLDVDAGFGEDTAAYLTVFGGSVVIGTLRFMPNVYVIIPERRRRS